MHTVPEIGAIPMAGGTAQHRLSGTREKLCTGFGWLDSLVGGFSPPEMVLIDSSSSFLSGLLSELCVQAVTAYGTQAVFVDGGNSIRPYEIARIAKFRSLDPNAVLSRINVARAFTAHQMAELVNGSLEGILRKTGASTVIVSSLLDLFLDQDMRWNESFQLVKRSLVGLDRLTRERELICIVSNSGSRKLDRTRFLRATMGHYPDRVISMEPTPEGMLVSLPRTGRYLHRYPVPRGQTVLERYFRGCHYGQDCRDI